MSALSYDDAVNDALERLDDLGYERGEKGDLANHGPMGAEAVALLGYPDEVASWVRDYRERLPHHDPPEARFALDPAAPSSWREALGVFERAGDWEALFARELADAPWREVLGRWWPRLLPGLLAGLTHGLIRTAHAVRSLAGTEDPSPTQLRELARGLAYWAARYHAPPGTPELVGGMGVAEAMAALPRTAQAGPVELLRHPERVPGYERALTALAPDQEAGLLGELTLRFADVYLHHPEVFPVPLVHGVTAPAAARIVLPHLPADQYRPTVAALWRMSTVLLLAFTGSPNGEGTGQWREQAGEIPEFRELAARAVEHGDEHVIKFTEACRREYTLRPDPRYRAAADAARQRITPAVVAGL